MNDRCRFGVNYVPAKNWFYSWLDWDREAIGRDLAAIRRLGFDHIRAHCLWPVFQPGRTYISPTALARLGELVDLAGAVGLDVSVCVLNGWMSGTYFRPPWQGEALSVFADPDALAAERLLLDAVGEVLATRRNILGLDIGNEPNVMAQFVGNAVTREQGDAWVRDLLGHADRVLPGLMHVVGVDHAPWLRDDGPFGRQELARAGAASVVHSWVYFTGALERYGAGGVGTLHLARYLVELARAYASDPDRPVWLQEIGVSAQWIPEPELSRFATTILANALAARPWAVTWWCSHDVDRSLAGFDELEYDLGLLTVNNEVKPVGAAVSRFIAEYRESGDAGAERGARAKLVLPRGRVPDLGFADEFFSLVAAGKAPSIVLE